MVQPEEASRYGTSSATKLTEAAKGSLSAADVAPAVARLRATFTSEKTLSKEWRVSQLRAFQRLLHEGRDQLCEAMRADLHKSPFEGYATECV